MSLAVFVLSGFAAAALTPLLHRLTRRYTGLLLSLLPASIFIFLLTKASLIGAGGVSRLALPWVPDLGIKLSFYLDGLSLLFSLIITGVGVVIFAYSGSYLGGHPQLGRFFAFLLMFMASMLGVVLADNVMALFVFWELTSLSSYLLIGFEHERKEARDAALQALLVTALGGLALLSAFLLLGQVGKSFELSVLTKHADLIRSNSLYPVITLLLLAGAFTKSAQFPFHFWLPNAMEAPTPVSAYLHSATMVKAGIYLLARVAPFLGGTAIFSALVEATGLATFLLGGYLALQRQKLKEVLAYATVSVLGMLTFLLGIGTKEAVAAAFVYLLAHSLYKGSLFLVTGNIMHETGTQEVSQLGELARQMRMTALSALLAGLSFAGLPPFLGFAGKELIYAATLRTDPGFFLSALAVLGNMFLVGAAARVVILPFFGIKSQKLKSKLPHEASGVLWFSALLPAGLGLFLGVVLPFLGKGLFAPAVSATLSQALDLHLSLWHGLNELLALSGITLLGGAAVFFAREPLQVFGAQLEKSLSWGALQGYELSLDLLNKTASGVAKILQTGYLRFYLKATMLATVVAVLATLILKSGHLSFPASFDARFYELALAAIVVAASLCAVCARSWLGAALSLGIVGYTIALIYVIFGAPDLAITQFSIESLTVVLFVFVLYRFPPFRRLSDRGTRLRDALVALASGGMVALLSLATMAERQGSRLSHFFAEKSYLMAHGKNVVNVILVDFRGFDTLGEITVLSVAGIGVFALLKLRLEEKKK